MGGCSSAIGASVISSEQPGYDLHPMNKVFTQTKVNPVTE